MSFQQEWVFAEDGIRVSTQGTHTAFFVYREPEVGKHPRRACVSPLRSSRGGREVWVSWFTKGGSQQSSYTVPTIETGLSQAFQDSGVESERAQAIVAAVLLSDGRAEYCREQGYPDP